MKYVVIARDLTAGRRQELPFIFPEDVTHADMAALLGTLLKGVDARVVAAGEVLFNSSLCCFGRCTSLDKPSRHQFDEHLIRFHDYRHGLISNE